jgi:cytochrome P450
MPGAAQSTNATRPARTVDEQSTVDLASVDLTDPSWFTDGPPHALFARMRKEAPVHRNNSADGHQRWSLTRAADITMVSKQPKLFSSYKGSILGQPDSLAPLEVMRKMLIIKDAPEHTKHRMILQAAFTPSTISKLEIAVRDKVVALLDEACLRGRMDVVADLARPIPLLVIASLLGAPESDIGKLNEWTTRIDRAEQDSTSQDGPVVFAEMGGYLGGLVGNQPDDSNSLVSALQAARIDGRALTDEEIVLFFAILVFAGNETTRHTTSHAMLAFIEHPEQFAAIAANPTLIPNAMEETLRWATPLNYFSRTATTDTEIGGQQIAEGDRLMMWYASGSRDEAIFNDPMRFDVTRTPGNHQAFGGGGRHFCLGAALARLELRVIFEEIVQRISNPVLAGPIQKSTTAWVNGVASLPITFVPITQ